jgi:DNA-directed RNA polymerase III subunit RPC4
VYSDDEDGDGKGGRVLDMGAVSAQGESAPTALIRAGRERREGEDDKSGVKKAKGKGKGKSKSRDKGKAKARGEDEIVVKPEPISPEKRDVPLGDVDVDMDEDSGVGARPPRAGRVDDTLMPGDERMDVDEHGRRVGTSASASASAEPEVDTANAVDLSESESEDEEDDMHGDFVQEVGLVSCRLSTSACSHLTRFTR